MYKFVILINTEMYHVHVRGTLSVCAHPFTFNFNRPIQNGPTNRRLKIVPKFTFDYNRLSSQPNLCQSISPPARRKKSCRGT